jgi:uncharacterized RDD family membrane protein YckC
MLQPAEHRQCPVCGFNLTRTGYFNPVNPLNRMRYIGFWPRLWACCIDTALVLAIIVPVLLWTYGWPYVTSPALFKGPLDVLLTWILPAVAVIAFWKYRSATPGKMLIQAKIIDMRTGHAPALPQLILRYYAYCLSLLPACAGFIWISMDQKKQGWHDKIAGTAVVSTQRNT